MTQEHDQAIPLTIEQAALIRRLLSLPFPGREELYDQVPFASHGEPWRTIPPSFFIDVERDDAPAARVEQRVPVAGHGVDSDGMGFEVLLHVYQGYLNAVEVWRGDGTAMISPIVADDVVVTVYPPL